MSNDLPEQNKLQTQVLAERVNALLSSAIPTICRLLLLLSSVMCVHRDKTPEARSTRFTLKSSTMPKRFALSLTMKFDSDPPTKLSA